MKISGVYEIVNTITGDFYIGSTVDLEKRKKEHFYKSTWRQNQNKPLYKDMKQYGKNNFLFKTIWLCEPYELKKYEQAAIEKYKPKYNVKAAYIEMSKEEYRKQWYKENADSIKQYNKQYYKENADDIKQKKRQYRKEHMEYMKQYRKEHADSIKQQQKQYYNRQCLYENEILTLCALRKRFARQGVEHSTIEAKKYLIGE